MNLRAKTVQLKSFSYLFFLSSTPRTKKKCGLPPIEDANDPRPFQIKWGEENKRLLEKNISSVLTRIKNWLIPETRYIIYTRRAAITYGVNVKILSEHDSFDFSFILSSVFPEVETIKPLFMENLFTKSFSTRPNYRKMLHISTVFRWGELNIERRKIYKRQTSSQRFSTA